MMAAGVVLAVFQQPLLVCADHLVVSSLGLGVLGNGGKGLGLRAALHVGLDGEDVDLERFGGGAQSDLWGEKSVEGGRDSDKSWIGLCFDCSDSGPRALRAETL